MFDFGLHHIEIMYKKGLLFFLGSILFTLANAQQSSDVLFTIDESPVYISEFKRVYLKNIDLVKDKSQKNIDEYLNLFINYKLKLKEAKHLGLDKKQAYLEELEGYRKQLAKGYLTDTRTSDALIRQAYDRSLEQINASHILIMVKPNASAKDTIAAYQKIIEARNKVVNGESFDVVAKAYSQDPSVAKNNGNLGWFSAFRMVYPFEEAAYETKVGEVSEPFRTQFGYHVVKVNGREKKLGEVTVAHIMVAINNNRTSEEAEKRIKEINQQLQQGVSFASLAKQYSDDPSTAIEGGKIRRFGQGALNSEKFEKTAFALGKKGEISTPIQTKYGWHIIQLIEKHPLKSFEEQKNELTKKVKRDSRSKLVTTSFLNSLKKKYAITKNEKAVAYFKEILPATFSKEEWNVPEDKNLKKELFTLKKEKYLYEDFAEFLKSNQIRIERYLDISAFVEEMYTQFESKTLLRYYEEHLEEDNKDFANVIGEYRDGLLLFDLMESKIWNVSKTDSIGLKKYYETQKDKYTQNEAYKVLKASSSKQEAISKVEKLLKKKKSIKEIKNEVNKGDIALVLFSEEELAKGDAILPKNFSAEKGEIVFLEEENFKTLIMVKEILPSRIKTFEETKGEVINDFQESIENKWLDHLRVKYPVKVNEKTLKKAKKELSI
ncbi:peptidyl-prolyl cis-trans isomerase SurA [Aquimarina sp. EL_43]|uniref:peptidylprolyl isomerase n=2 Tax=Flavobacteriaceae TaxID=49546 RepID=UPI0006869E1E|nr:MULTISPECIES: peptidylprolyl isomerase [Aquimarina]MBG6128834.1 peptidyl-prolyl cis-trans isomerase SurA [Aquimarina sp. EL_35]MBG6149897.1 peptidyl-prolyl cis-trans isomerase SurA [Aquimarina sp. EL_32]MBG6167416.1 peptidyl-prolyl cis-trans isomerase SurA [Aquimarina sp. EL_43]